MSTLEPQHDLLSEALLGVRTSDGGHALLTLPEVLTRLGEGGIAGFSALQAHQAHALHAFLVQLAAMALHKAGRSDPRAPSADWKELLLGLAQGSREAFCLVVPDLSRPAFLQPPVPEGSLRRFKNPSSHPDGIDVLITSKNHDVKAARIRAPRPEHWIYALISLQTMQGYSGSGNYGIARMNSGSGSRPCVTFAPSINPGDRFRRDVAALIESRSEVAAQHQYASAEGVSLLWLLPWDGATSVPLQQCDPYFVEVCRRVRLTASGRELTALSSSTDGTRISNDKDRLGKTGDPWTPIHRGTGKSLTASSASFGYDRIQTLLFQNDFDFGPVGNLLRSDGKGQVLLASALVRGQCKTEGLHERTLPLPAKARAILRSQGEREKAGALAKIRVEAVAKAKSSMLKPALCALLQAGAEKLNFRDERADRWLDQLDAEIDLVFFDALWRALDGEDDVDANLDWESLVCTMARGQLDQAIGAVSLPAVRRYRAITAAQRVFYGARRKHFPEVAAKLAVPNPKTEGEA